MSGKSVTRGIKDIIGLEIKLPGRQSIANVLMEKQRYKAVEEVESKGHEAIYRYENGIYKRAEELIRRDAHLEYVKWWKEAVTKCNEALRGSKKNSNDWKHYESLLRQAEKLLDNGPSTTDLNEITDIIRRTSFVSPNLMNPVSHIPFRNGYLNVETWELENSTPELFMTWRVEANLLVDLLNRISLNDVPRYKLFLLQAYQPEFIPLEIQYNGYALYGGFPAQKVLFDVGREEKGKGTHRRLLRRLFPLGYGSFDLGRLLSAERFALTGTRDKNVLVDPEIKRRFRRGVPVDWKTFNSLFGADTVSDEKKGLEAQDREFKAKAFFNGNLPLWNVDNPAAFRRMLIALTSNGPKPKRIEDLDRILYEEEGDKIATLWIRYLKLLKRFEWRFFGELSNEGNASLWTELSDPVELFSDEMTQEDENSWVKADEAYSSFESWCKTKGIPTLTYQTFVRKFKDHYSKGKRGGKGKQVPVFLGCEILDVDSSGHQDKLDTTLTDGRKPKITVSWVRQYGISLVELYPTSCDHTLGVSNTNRVRAQKRDTSISSTESPILHGSKVDKPVSNLSKLTEITTDPKELASSPFSIAEAMQEDIGSDEVIQGQDENTRDGSPESSFIVIRPFNPDGDPEKRGLPCEEGDLLSFSSDDEFGQALRREGYIAPFKGRSPA